MANRWEIDLQMDGQMVNRWEIDLQQLKINRTKGEAMQMCMVSLGYTAISDSVKEMLLIPCLVYMHDEFIGGNAFTVRYKSRDIWLRLWFRLNIRVRDILLQ